MADLSGATCSQRKCWQMLDQDSKLVQPKEAELPILYLTGVDDQGRSRVSERRELVSGADPFEALRLAPEITTFPEGSPEVMLLESPTPPGGALYRIYTWSPGQRSPMHRTITTDFDVVLEGSLEMVLETETVTLNAGDCAVLPGIAHAWVSGADGAIVMYNLVAGNPSQADSERHRVPFG
jgi:quercetin dioxygenase-like cupin family protein